MNSVRSYLGRSPLGELYRSVRNDRVPQIKYRFSSKQRAKLFTGHYSENHWATEESRSGPGSTLSDTVNVREQLPLFLRKYSVASLLDVPCGDWAWMREVDLGATRYIGADIVPDLIADLKKLYERPNVTFMELDIVKHDVPTVQAILCRDLLIHLPNGVEKRLLRKFAASGADWLITTTNTGVNENAEVVQGRYRPINLLLPPFSLPEPTQAIIEGTGKQPSDLGRCLGIWDLRHQNF